MGEFMPKFTRFVRGLIFDTVPHHKWDKDGPSTGSAFADKYKKAIIFLVVILIIAFILIVIYVLLKREMCNCFGDKKKADDEEGLYTSSGDDMVDRKEELTDDDLPTPVDERLLNNDIPDVVVTESLFVPEKRSKKKQIKSIFKKRRKGSKSPSVTFSDVSERSSLIGLPNGSYDHGYGYGTNLDFLPLQRADSMESFVSTVSTATNNAEEFGEELSPSRIQVVIQYDPRKWVLNVGARQADCLVTTNKETIYWQVHITLLPFKKQKFKTRYKSSCTPVFSQTFDIENIAQQALTQLSVRYRIYGRSGRAGRKKLAGETEVELSRIMSMENYLIKDWRVLKRKTVPTLDTKQTTV